MPLKLPRLSSILSIVDQTRKATREFGRFWDTAMETIETGSDTQEEIIANLAALVTQQQGILSGLVSFSVLNVNGESVTTLVTDAADLGLGNVEDKSAADIIGEITALDVTNALTYTPVNKAGDTMSGILDVPQLNVSGTKVIGAQGSAVPDAAGGATIDAEARTALNALLAQLRTHGLIAP